MEGLLYIFERQPYLASHVTTAEKALKLKLLTFYNNEYNTNVRRALFGTSWRKDLLKLRLWQKLPCFEGSF